MTLGTNGLSSRRPHQTGCEPGTACRALKVVWGAEDVALWVQLNSS
jgi:hypothetical protein